MYRTYLLSPARLNGQRAQMLFRPRSPFPIAVAIREPQGAELGHVFRFMSGLYFRGKLAYAERFARDPENVQVITTNRGLLPARTKVTLEDLHRFSQTDIHADSAEFRDALLRDVRALATKSTSGQVVLLGSIATAKYIDALLEVLGDRLVFPTDFVGRGDMSRGGLLLRAADAGHELNYAPVRGATLHGSRPPKLARRRRGASLRP